MTTFISDFTVSIKNVELAVQALKLFPHLVESQHEALDELRQRLLKATTNLRKTLGSQKFTNLEKNIINFFRGFEVSNDDSGRVKYRKKADQKRCERICRLSLNRVVSWALDLEPHKWRTSEMGHSDFEDLIKRFEHSEPNQWWSAEVHKSLCDLANGPLANCVKYHEFLRSTVCFF